MKEIIAVGTGGFIGAVLRFLLTKVIPNVPFPFATLAANVFAGIAVGAVMGLDDTVFALPPKWRLFAATGILGGLSTFSTFNYETIRLFESGKQVAAGINITVSLFLAFAGVFLGRVAVRAIFAKF